MTAGGGPPRSITGSLCNVGPLQCNYQLRTLCHFLIRHNQRDGCIQRESAQRFHRSHAALEIKTELPGGILAIRRVSFSRSRPATSSHLILGLDHWPLAKFGGPPRLPGWPKEVFASAPPRCEGNFLVTLDVLVGRC